MPNYPSVKFEAVAFNLQILAVIFGIITVPLLNLQECLLWFDVTPKAVALFTSVGIGCIGLSLQGNYIQLPRIATLLIGAWTLSALLSTGYSLTPHISLGGSAWRRCGLPTELSLSCFMLLTMATVRYSDLRLRWLLRAVSTVLGATALGVLLQVFDVSGFIGLAPPVDIARPGGFLGAGHAFGCFVPAVVFLVAGHLVVEGATKWGLLAQGSLLLGLVAMWFCGTRATILGLLIGSLALSSMAKGISGRLLKILLLGTAAFFAAVLVWSLAGVNEPIPSLLRWQQVLTDPLGGSRLAIWRDCLTLIEDLPVFGYGIESFPRVFIRVQSAMTTALWPHTFFESPHSLLVDTLLAKGPFGLIILFATTASSFILHHRVDEEHRPLSSCLIASHLAGFGTCLFFSPQIPTLLFTYLPLAVLSACLSSAHGSQRVDDYLHTSASWAYVVVAGIRVLTFGFGVAVLIYGCSLLIWDRQLFITKRAISAGQLTKADEIFRESRLLAPPFVSGEAWYSQELLTGLDSAQSHPLKSSLYYSLNKAVMVEERYAEASILLAALMLTDGRTEEAKRELLCLAIEFPAWQTPRNLLFSINGK